MKFWEQIRIYEGSIFQFSFPALCIPVDTHDEKADLEQLEAIVTSLRPLLSGKAQSEIDKVLPADGKLLAVLFNAVVSALELDAEMPIIGRKIVALPGVEEAGVTARQLLFIETIDPRLVMNAINLIKDMAAGEPGNLKKRHKQLIESASPFARSRTNNKHFVRALKKLAIPVSPMPGDVLLCGWGEKSRFLNSSSTEHTGATPLDMVRDKSVANQMLRMANLPVAQQEVVATVQEAVQAAKEIGFPVVVKPRSRDGGVGVTRDVRDEATLRSAFDRAKAEDRSIIVERHVNGKEYRILFVMGKLISMHERVPATVVGNGKDTVARLIETENARRLAADHSGFRNFQIKISDDTDRCLATQGMTMKSVPDDGLAVRLATVPKSRTGGDAVQVDWSLIHPEILEAASRAARMFRLDVAGVDYLTTDYTRSISETGGAITEVNALPQINPFDEFDVHANFLSTLLAGVGRIPALLVTVSGQGGIDLVRKLADRARSNGLRPGILTGNDLPIPEGSRDDVVCASYANRVGLLGDQTVNCIIAVQTPENISQRGLVLPHVDAALLTGQEVAKAASVMCGPLVRENLRGPAITDKESAARGDLERAFGSDRVLTYSDAGQREALLMKVLGAQNMISDDGQR